METDYYISFTKVALEHGWMGNMSPYPIEYDGKIWRTCEALFQALRFDDEEIREIIREQKSPMAAKMKAKKHRESMKIKQMSTEDISNMKKCVCLKLEQHPILQDKLIETKACEIYENVSTRPRGSGMFWGAAFVNGKWCGNNTLGKILMELREELITQKQGTTQ
jgi:hypothetical protein